MSEFKLISKIESFSESDTWDKAKLEWELKELYIVEDPARCLCSHYPILNICILVNKHNHKRISVGNCCVKKFVGLPSDIIFQAIKRIQGDPHKSLNAEAIDHAYTNDWITPWEHDFCVNTMRKQKLSTLQIRKRAGINKKVLTKIVQQTKRIY
jgi:hypothetical protein